MGEPSRIYLQIPDDCDGYDDASPVTWCKDRINDGDLEYVRAHAPDVGRALTTTGEKLPAPPETETDDE